jgi:N-acetylmuramic acid 6-phosphate etherase
VRHDDLAVRSRLTSLDAARSLIASVARIAGDVRPVDAVGIGISGYVHDLGLLEAVAAGIADVTGAAHVVVAGDVLTSYLGALGARPGAVAALGSGSIVLALGREGSHAIVDGWGHALGDDGSGFAVGRSGLKAALRHLDGRGRRTDLVDRARERFGPLERLADVIDDSAAPTLLIASFARDVAASAREGDAEAIAIWSHAAREVAASVAAARRRAATPENAPTAVTGALTNAGDLLLAPLAAVLGTTISVHEHAALDGAQSLLDGDLDELPPELHYRLKRV